MLGIVCGMVSEARALGRWAGDECVRIGITGARPDRAESEARRLIAAGCRLLLSWGVAGGLDPEMRPGDLVIPSAVVDETGGCWPLSAELTGAARGALAGVRRQVPGDDRRILGLDRLALTPEDKAALFARTRALSADTETHRLARAAAAAGLPAFAVRAVGDPAAGWVPELATRALTGDGRPRLGAVALGLLRRPSDLGALVRVKRETDAALASLTGAADDVLDAIQPPLGRG